ncbi:kinase-like protein [Lentithecium fluviatile CBS 122367]|uniref:Kinase-like protein n=1 Tax=Lentithecium fluviatile CBS 122367 TaxID=1168545 RepID=A0A6G1ILC0_9PLEO|nr:kinase-like protein [Lentithecium fluviatile CBS 122367]
MPSTNDLTTEDGLSTYLKAKNVEHTFITLLTGGTANYVYRATLPDVRTVIYKHAAPYLHSNKAFAFDPTRMDYEDRVLEILPPLLKQQIPKSAVHAVGWYSYDRDAKLLCIEDGGERELKKAYSDERLDVKRIGEEVGRWIAALHTCSTETSLSLTDEKDLNANNPVGVAIYRYSYNNLTTALVEYGHDAEFGKYINEVFGSKLATDNECVCHGDFWPGNVLVKFRDEKEQDVDLTVVDWEMTRRGTSATDVGQFAAESFLLDRFRGGKGLLPAFLNAYSAARKDDPIIDREWVRRMAVHWAVHVAFWPTGVKWVDREGTEKLVDIGVGVLRAVVDGDWETLRASELFRDVDDILTTFWEIV